MTQRIDRDEVLAALHSRGNRSLHLMEVLEQLDLDKGRKDDVLDVVLELVGLGLARELPGGRFKLALKKSQAKRRSAARPERRDEGQAGQEEARGWLTVTKRGFAFVAADDGGPDVFIPPTGLGPAMHGDRVRVATRPSTRGHDGREGRVVEVLRRGLSRIAGTLSGRGRRSWIEPGDPRLPERVEVVGTVPLGIEVGDEVVALIERHPTGDGDPGAARVLQRLGPKGSAAVEIEKIKIREGVEDDFEAAVLGEAQAWGTALGPADFEGREDLRDLGLCTIDPPDARDHDDAVWAERLADGAFRVIVAIADVSHYVRPGSALDDAALARGTSIYLPEGVIPMLPHELSSNLASLVPHEDRLCMAVEVKVGPRGVIREHRFIEGVMRSRARLSYEGVAQALGLSETAPAQPAAEERRELLRTLFDVAKVLRERRVQRGSLDFDLPEPKILLDARNEPLDIQRSRSDPGLRKAYGMIEDLMLLANEVVAADLDERGLPAIYRVHGEPKEERIALFCELAASLGYGLDEEAARRPGTLSKFLRRIEGNPREQALNFLLLRSMQQASYDTNNVGHFALAARHYLHFTSPIRRYPDLAVHRVVRDVIHGRAIDRATLKETLVEQAAQASRLERRAMTVDREVTDLYRALLMKDRIGESFEATVTMLNPHAVYVSFDEPFVDGKIPVERLADYYELDHLGLRMTARRSGHSFTLGDRLTVRLAEVSVEQRELLCAPEGNLSDERRDSRSRRGGAPGEEARSPSGDPRDGGWARGKRRRAGGTRRDDRFGPKAKKKGLGSPGKKGLGKKGPKKSGPPRGRSAKTGARKGGGSRGRR